MRSYLYVPGDQPDRMRSALGRGADALILDLEDAVAHPNKIAARESVAHFLSEIALSEIVLSQTEDGRIGPKLWVRINTGDVGLDDIAMVVRVNRRAQIRLHAEERRDDRVVSKVIHEVAL